LPKTTSVTHLAQHFTASLVHSIYPAVSQQIMTHSGSVESAGA
jgi:hypothetical protein